MNKSAWQALICLHVIFTGIGAVASAKEAGKDNFDVLFYRLDLNVSDSSIYIEGSNSVMLKSVVPALQQVVLDFSRNMTTDSVLINEQKVPFTHTLHELVIDLLSPADSGELITTTIYYHGPVNKAETTSGIYNNFNSEWNMPVTWTLSEPFSALNWFPCKQSLTDKADSVYVYLSTNSNRKAGSNGLLTAQVPLPGNRIRYEWKSRFPIAYYLISFTVSNYLDYSFYVKRKNEPDSILVQNYIYNNAAYFEQNKANIDKTADLILLFEDLFGRYPFAGEKYGHCVAPFGGGMEHQTMTTLVNFSFLLVAHELSHQWFGDAVTCSTWQDIWINEGFASYSEYLANQYLKSQDAADLWINEIHEVVKLMPNGSVFVPEDYMADEDRIFDSRLSYKKGAAIIHMIRQEVNNDSLFFNVLSDFIANHKNGTATGVDFRNHLEALTGIDFNQFFDQWYFGEGYPIYAIDWHYSQDTLYINSLQTTSAETRFANVLLEFGIRQNNKDSLISLRQTNSFSNWKVYLPGAVSSVSFDPRHWLLCKAAGLNNTKSEEVNTKFKVIPNPARDEVSIQFSGHLGNYMLYLADSTGKILDSKESESQNIMIDINNYPPGMYFIIIRNNNTFYHEKFVIN
jgi:aminopeptidase N